MPNEPLALSTVPPPATADTDYDAICSAVTATARGRWFLDEYAKRNRHSDTTQVLAAIARMEAAVVGDRAQQASHQAHQEVRIELLEMARSIAQTRAEVAESRPDPSQPAAETAGESAPDVAAAAERLRQIAWTMRACGIDLPASDQIGQIADTILSADALRNLGNQRAHKLTEALHYLEHRIDRMLDGHLAAAAAVTADDAAEPDDDPVSTASGANDNDHHADAALPTQAAPLAVIATTRDPEPGIEATPSAEDDDPTAAAFAAEANAVGFSMDDDVVLTVADRAIEPGSESEPLSEAARSPEPPPEPATSDSLMGEADSAADAAEPMQADTGIEPEPIPATDFVATARQDERTEHEATPLVAPVQAAAADVEDEPEAAFGALGLEPLVVVPAAAALQGGLPSAAAQIPAQEATQEPTRQPADEPASALAAAADIVAGEPVIERPATSAEERDAIAMQVEHDLDQLTDAAPVVSSGDAAPARQEAPARSDLATAARADDPAEFLLEAPVEMVPDHAPMAALVASAQATRAQLSTALAAIETELSATAPLPVRTEATTVTRPASSDGPLAALMLLSEEERLALFS